MTDPITPPPGLVQQWSDIKPMGGAVVQNWVKIATKAAQWGADQELEACYAEVSYWASKGVANEVRTARRPKPPSLKEQALEAARRFYANGHEGCTDEELTDDFHTIRRALEQLND
jgi:hypothetical protein